MAHLITGYAGVGHVTAADDALFHAGICGEGKYVLRTGTQFAHTIVSNNQITIGSGDLVNQGRHINIPTNTTEDVTIENGTQGKTRIDLIAMRYTKDQSTGVESAAVVVIKGTPVDSGSALKKPSYNTGNLFTGDYIDDFPLYWVTINNLEIGDIETAFTVISPLAEVLESIYPVGAIYISTAATNPSTIFGGTWQQIEGRFLIGRSSSRAAGTTGGEESVELTTSNLPAHTHSVPAHTHGVPSHTHTATASSSGAHKHAEQRAKLAASGTARYAAQDNSAHETHNSLSAGEHTHTITVNGSGKLTTESAGNGNTGSTGQSVAHNNMPPFLAVYMWTRTA